MQITDNLNGRYNYLQNMTGKNDSALQGSGYHFSDAITMADSEDEGTFLGLTMIPEEGKTVVYGMRAMLSEESTPDKPIVQIISNLDGQKEIYNVDISKVDPKNASRMEIFALCCYEDKMGTGTGSTFGSFHTLKMYEETAKQNGQMKTVDESLSAWEQFTDEKRNWCAISEAALETLKNYNSPDAKILDLILKGQKLLTIFSKYA
ncbi:MAG: hypothetical protein NC079_01855 [Clostridium sp.]|nr:hypothetical protein [Acetatifactor muris]MCM1526542.1 hypothetical protein [Bacteroides sp.]MCM1562332.1 hypothetical protein [Clostridium sp.]